MSRSLDSLCNGILALHSFGKASAAKSATPSKADPLRARLSSTPASILKAKMKANKSLSTAEKLAKAMSDMTPDSVELVTPSPRKVASPRAKVATPKAKLVTPKAEMVTSKAKGTPKTVRMMTPSGGRATPSSAAASAMKSVKKTPYTASQKKRTPAPAAAGTQFNRKISGLNFGLKNGLRFCFDSGTCLNYPFLRISSV